MQIGIRVVLRPREHIVFSEFTLKISNNNLVLESDPVFEILWHGLKTDIKSQAYLRMEMSLK